jgi:peptidoglycan/xylan/chitin deacetylase (PgdA/CDA1 family)
MAKPLPTGSIPAPLLAPRGGVGAMLARRATARTVARPALLRPARPTVSFTFDGFPQAAARTGASLVENVGGRATFYACAHAAGEVTPTGPAFGRDDLARLIGRGHEVGCMTYSGADCGRRRPGEVFADMVRNGDALATLGLEARLISFAYPHGETSAALKQTLPSRFTSARGARVGLASGAADLAQLRSNAMYGRGALARCLEVLDLARNRAGWVIFHTHDVSPRPTPLGTPTGLMERLCGAAFAGGMRILPVAKALELILAESEG